MGIWKGEAGLHSILERYTAQLVLVMGLSTSGLLLSILKL